MLGIHWVEYQLSPPSLLCGVREAGPARLAVHSLLFGMSWEIWKHLYPRLDWVYVEDGLEIQLWLSGATNLVQLVTLHCSYITDLYPDYIKGLKLCTFNINCWVWIHLAMAMLYSNWKSYLRSHKMSHACIVWTVTAIATDIATIVAAVIASVVASVI